MLTEGARSLRRPDALFLCVYGRMMDDPDLANQPTVCPNGHPLGPGKSSLSYSLCDDCGTGHHRLYCNTCTARLWLGHPGAVWERPTGSGWEPA